ncbi:PaaX family transcriptional regulator C-terminal domain-containing protein [Phycicoccus sp. Root101]|uniref:PaaX family transcriptional regulator n=1 Tax=Phycicoccus sp. Root101 TaxID=1736421 RepID=UPI000703A774|nr:PaaX family transcriptional regulator C-terminal domain-containing protein [Phycicoccus sp. Root101]KQU65363.1 PaaX family transcriptional regulator [Phycicoccus sp. Root101]
MTTTELDGGAERGPLPPRALIVTVLGLYVREFGGWISVSALIRLMAAAGVDEQAVRSALSRLKRRGIVEAERRGGAAGYALSEYARQLLEVGDRRIFAEREAHTRDWVVVVFSVPESERQKRHALRARLSWLGFGTVSSGVWIAPGRLADDAREVLLGDGLDPYVDLFRAEYLAFGDPATKIARWWDLEALEQLYTDFLEAHEPARRHWEAQHRVPPGGEAFSDYVRALTSWRRLPYLDPGLPTDLLPASWSGTTAAQTFFALHRMLAGPAHDFVTAQAGAARPG